MKGSGTRRSSSYDETKAGKGVFLETIGLMKVNMQRVTWRCNEWSQDFLNEHLDGRALRSWKYTALAAHGSRVLSHG